MKKLVHAMLSVIMVLAIQHGYAQTQDVPAGAIMIDANTIIKDETGDTIETAQFMELMNSGEWMLDPVNDIEGKLQYIQLRKASEHEKKMMMKMQMDQNNSGFIGQQAPDFKMTDLQGNEISMESSRGKVIVLNFWFIACKPCVEEIPHLNEVYEQYKGNPNVVFASITFDKSDQVKSFLQQIPISYPVVADGRETSNLFGISGFPTNIVIDKKGNYADYILGGNPEIGKRISNSIQMALEDKQSQYKPNAPEAVKLDSESIYKLENGDTVPFSEVIDILNSSNYDIVPLQDEDNRKCYLLKKRK